MLQLSDPLWQKLDAAQQGRDIAGLLVRLAETWDDVAADHLFWDCLCHQETCCRSTYAAVPHLLSMAQPDENLHQRRKIAHFLGFVALCAFDTRSGSDSEPHANSLNGFPSHPAKPFNTDPVDDEHEKLDLIRTEFIKSIPDIRVHCQKAFIENLADEDVARYLLGGIAAADGLFDLARFLDHGFEGSFRCAACNWEYEYMLLQGHVAIYASAVVSGEFSTAINKGRDAAVSDYENGVVSRSDGYISPLKDANQTGDDRVTELLALADRTGNPELALFLHNMLGNFVCKVCGVEGPIRRL